MDSESVAKPGRSAKSRIFAWGLLSGVVIAAVAFWWMENRTEPTDSPTVLNISDGSGLMGREILTAAAVLSNERVVKIEFLSEGTMGSVAVIDRRRLDSLSVICEPFLVRVTPFGVHFEEEKLSRDAFHARVALIAESARLTDSRGFILLSCADGTSGEMLVNILRDLSEVESMDLILPDHRWIFEPHPTPPPSPQVKPLAHPVELK